MAKKILGLLFYVLFLDLFHPVGLFFFFKILFIFRERGREGEREGEKHLCERETSSHCLLHTPTQDLACNPGMCPDGNQTGNLLVWRRTTPNLLSHTSQGLFLYISTSLVHYFLFILISKLKFYNLKIYANM